MDSYQIDMLRDPKTNRVAVSARWVVGHQSGRHVLMENAEMVFAGGEVIFVGRNFAGEVASRIDFGNAMIGPGFVDLDALGDLDTTVLVFDNHPAEQKGRIWPEAYWRGGARETLTRDALRFQKQHAYAHCLRNGITTAAPVASLLYRQWAEAYWEFEDAVDVAGELGLRAYLGPAFRDRTSILRSDGSVTLADGPDDAGDGLNAAVRFVENFSGAQGDLIRGLLAPDRLEHLSAEMLERTVSAAQSLRTPVRIHACQGTRDYALTLESFGVSPVERLDRAGLLTPRTIVPHLTHVSGSRYITHEAPDLEIFAASGASVAHCPVVSARQGDALSLSDYRQRGIPVGLGTDTWPASMVENMRVGGLVNRIIEARPDAASAADLYTLATVGGANALGRADLGRLTEGARADFTVFDLDLPHLGQVFDPVQAMLISGRGDEFSHVFVDGRMVVAEGRVLGFDIQDGHAAAQSQLQTMLVGLPERSSGTPPLDQIVAPTFKLA